MKNIKPISIKCLCAIIVVMALMSCGHRVGNIDPRDTVQVPESLAGRAETVSRGADEGIWWDENVNILIEKLDDLDSLPGLEGLDEDVLDFDDEDLDI